MRIYTREPQFRCPKSCKWYNWIVLEVFTYLKLVTNAHMKLMKKREHGKNVEDIIVHNAFHGLSDSLGSSCPLLPHYPNLSPETLICNLNSCSHQAKKEHLLLDLTLCNLDKAKEHFIEIMRVLKRVCNILEFHHVQLQAHPTYGKALLMRMNDMCLHKPPLTDSNMLHWLPLAYIPAHMGHKKYLQLATERRSLTHLLFRMADAWLNINHQ